MIHGRIAPLSFLSLQRACVRIAYALRSEGTTREARMRTKTINPHEAARRAEKVTALVANALAYAPPGKTPSEIADAMARMPPTVRVKFAQFSKVKPASDLTWRIACDAVRAVECSR